MDLFALPPEDREVLVAACVKQGLDESYASFVAQHLDAADDSWRWCCGSNCDPCVQQLARAVDQARSDLRLPPTGLSAQDSPS